MCAPCPVATSPGGTRRGRGGAHGRPAALPRTPRAASDGTAGLLASGSSYSRAFPRGQPPLGGIHRAQWHISGFVPGYSGGGRAGITPASLSRTADLLAWRRRRHRTVGLSKRALGRRRRGAVPRPSAISAIGAAGGYGREWIALLLIGP